MKSLQGSGCQLWWDAPRIRPALLIMLVAVFSGCERSAEVADSNAVPTKRAAPAVSPEPAEGWAGSESCRECHEEVFARYSGHPMCLTLSRTATAPVVEDLRKAEFSTAGNRRYFVEREGNEFWHHEQRVSDSGELIYDQRVPIDIAVGSGVHGRSYLRNVEGRLYQSPVTWYTQDAHWALSPGYPEDFHDRFERRVTHACISCHTGRALPYPGEPDRFADPLFAEESIGCERCHGPGETHIAWQRLDQATRTGTDPVINPGHFTDSRLDAVCNQCHLAGQRRVLKNGLAEFDFRPGMHVSDIWTVFVKTKGIESGAAGAVSHVEQMHVSRCFQESQGALSCISCHDPHGVPTADQKADVYREQCLKCHGNGQTECSESREVRVAEGRRDSCIACHMAAYPAADVHSAQTDHRILRRPQPTPPASEVEDAQRGPVVPFEEPGVQGNPAEIARARGIYLSERAYFGGEAAAAEEAVTLLKESLRTAPEDVEALFSLGRALIQRGQLRDAEQTLETMLSLSPRHEVGLEVLATAQHESGKYRSARNTYEKLLKLNPARSRYYGRYAHVLGQLGDISGGIQAAEKALELDPSLAQAHQWLSAAYEKRSNPKRAEYHKRMAEIFEHAAP